MIAPYTIGQVVSIKSWATGIANTWDARPGEMLRQVADVEFPQMFKYYKAASQYEEPQQRASRLTVELSISHYVFSDFHTPWLCKRARSVPAAPSCLTNPTERKGKEKVERWLGRGLRDETGRSVVVL